MNAVAVIISWTLITAASTLVGIFSWKDYHFIYNHRLLFVVGLAFSRSLTNCALISILMWSFIYDGNELVMSAIFTNIQGSLSSFLVIVMTLVDLYFGRFHTLLFSNTAYIGGLLLLWMFNPYDVKCLLVIILVLVALGTSGENILQDVLIDLVNDIDTSQDKNAKRSLARATIWSHIAYVCGAISAILWVSPGAIVVVHSSWTSSFLICTIAMTITSMIFCKGHNVYRQGAFTKRPDEAFFRQRRLMTFRKHISPKNLEAEKEENERITQERSSQRLNKPNSSYKQEDTVVVKSLLRMFPMWGMFFVVSLILATGNTFFFEQFNNLNTNNQLVLQLYNVVHDFSSFAIPFLYRYICCSRGNEKVKIGVGMLCGIVSCIFAWQLEIYRLKEVSHLVNKKNTSISFLWLFPQFCMLGFMEGLTSEGLLKFYMSQMKEESLRRYGEEYIEFVMGFGKLLNIFLILVFKSQHGWFGDTINDSRLDKYYLVLVFVCSANFISYCCIARWFYKDRHQDLVNDDRIQDNELLGMGDHRFRTGLNRSRTEPNRSRNMRNMKTANRAVSHDSVPVGPPVFRSKTDYIT